MRYMPRPLWDHILSSRLTPKIKNVDRDHDPAINLIRNYSRDLLELVISFLPFRSEGKIFAEGPSSTFRRNFFAFPNRALDLSSVGSSIGHLIQGMRGEDDRFHLFICFLLVILRNNCLAHKLDLFSVFSEFDSYPPTPPKITIQPFSLISPRIVR
jgi:hypothetical protein